MMQMLAGAGCCIDRIPASSGLRYRELQERLQQQRTNYNQQLKRMRMEIADQRLRYRRIVVSALAWNQGHFDASVFSHTVGQRAGPCPCAPQSGHA